MRTWLTRATLDGGHRRRQRNEHLFVPLPAFVPVPLPAQLLPQQPPQPGEERRTRRRLVPARDLGQPHEAPLRELRRGPRTHLGQCLVEHRGRRRRPRRDERFERVRARSSSPRRCATTPKPATTVLVIGDTSTLSKRAPIEQSVACASSNSPSYASPTGAREEPVRAPIGPVGECGDFVQQLERADRAGPASSGSSPRPRSTRAGSSSSVRSRPARRPTRSAPRAPPRSRARSSVRHRGRTRARHGRDRRPRCALPSTCRRAESRVDTAASGAKI